MTYPGLTTFPGLTTSPGGAGASMGPLTLPTVYIEAALEVSPGTTPTNQWLDFSPLGCSVSIRRGRADRLARDEAGTMTLVLSDDARALDPTNADSTHFPNMKAMRRWRVRLEWAGVSYTVYTGFAEECVPVFVGESGNKAGFQVQCADLFKSLTLQNLSGEAWPIELSGARIHNGLDDLEWPTLERRIDAGVCFVVAETAETRTLQGALVPATAVGPGKEYLQQVAESDAGRLFVGGDGYIVFQDKRHRIDVANTSQATFTDQAGFNYVQMGAAFGDARLWNDATVAFPVTRGRQIAHERLIDTDSKGEFLRRAETWNTKLAFPGDAASMASLYLWRYALQQFEIPRLVLEPVADEWADVLPLLEDPSKRVTVYRQHPGGGDPTEEEFHIEGFNLELKSPGLQGGDEWAANVTFDLGLVDEISEWELGVSEYGVNTRIGV